MEFDSVVKKRTSIRSFTGKKASWKDVLETIDAALQGPFAGNHNNLKFLIIEDKESIVEVARLCEQVWIGEASILVLICSDDMHLENMYGERGRIYSRQQAGAAIMGVLLKLTDLGLGGCWVGAYADEIVKEKLGIPQNIQVEAIIPVGFEKEEKGKPERRKKPLEAVLFWEKWGQKKRPTIFDEGREDWPRK